MPDFMFYLFKRGRIWWIRGSVRGQKIRRTLETADREIALERRRELEREVWSGDRRRPRRWPEFAEEVLNFIAPGLKPLTLVKYRFVLARFGRFLASEQIQTVQGINARILAAYLANRQRDEHPTRRCPIGPEGLRSDLRVLHRLFAYAVSVGYLESNPVTQARAPQRSGETQPFSREEIARMLAACETRPGTGTPYPLRVIILTFIHTGFRISDVIGLEKKEVDLASGRIIRRTQKRGSVVSMPLHPELAAALSVVLSQAKFRRGSSLIFHTAGGKPLTSLDAYLGRLWKRAGIEHAHPHRFRDTFAVNLLQAGASIYDVAHLLGISVAVCEKHYAPYVRELQERGRKLIESVTFAGTAGAQSAAIPP